MKLVNVNPAYSFNAVDRLVNDLFKQGVNVDRYAKNEMGFQPATNVYELENAFKLELQIPGFSKELVKITVEKDLLTIKGEVEQKEAASEGYSKVEFKVENFEKRFKLSEKLDAEKIEANFSNGILSLVVPKREEAKPIVRSIEIS